jgi:hypothetical protein
MVVKAPIEPVKGIQMWIEQESIHLKAIDEPHNDPVELADHEAEAVIAGLQSLLDQLRRTSAR